jgi:hypothetical protein
MVARLVLAAQFIYNTRVLREVLITDSLSILSPTFLLFAPLCYEIIGLTMY